VKPAKDTDSSRQLNPYARLDPEFVGAQGNLGAEYSFLHRYGEAAAELHRAVMLDDPSAAWLQFLAFALLQAGKPAEAEQWA
jgi:hypothetical protein